MAERERVIFPRVHKPRGRVSDQQRRREIILERQKTARRDVQLYARNLANHSNHSTLTDSLKGSSLTGSERHVSSVSETSPSLHYYADKSLETESNVDNGGKSEVNMISELDNFSGAWQKIDKGGHVVANQREGEREREGEEEVDMFCEDEEEEEEGKEGGKDADRRVGDLMDGGRLWGQKACEWYKNQLMLPEWMVDIPSNLQQDWYVIPRPEGKRCLVISTNGTTVSRLRNGRVFHKFPSSLPNGARTREVAAASHVYCILDCIFDEASETYYVLDMMSWRGYSLFDCPTEFRFYWVNTKLEETGALGEISHFHRYRFQKLPVYDCSLKGLQEAYECVTPYKKDGLLFYNRHTHYTLGLTPLVLLWKDNHCSQYVIDTDSHGIIPPEQLVVLELCEDGSLSTSDNPPVVLGSLPSDIVTADLRNLKPGTLVRFAIGEGGVQEVEGLPRITNMQFQGLAHRRGAGADSCTKILFQYAARHDPITIQDLVSAIQSSLDGNDGLSMGASDVSALNSGLLTSMNEEEMESSHEAM